MKFMSLLDRAIARVLPAHSAGACIPGMGDCCRKVGNPTIGTLTCTGQCDLSHHC